MTSKKHLGISRKVLSESLKVLAEVEILERRQYQTRPDRFEYLLTDKGRDLLPIHLAIMEWHERWQQCAGTQTNRPPSYGWASPTTLPTTTSPIATT
jgi:DNA-binding HxlR family transcriptional regulator